MRIDPFVLCGGFGAAALMLVYFLNLRGWLASSDWRFPAANVAGSLLVLVSLLDRWNLPAFIMESFWMTISLYGLVRNLWRRFDKRG